jgi:hypothetical protein
MAFVNDQWRERMHRAHRGLHSSPLILGALGIGTLGLWACGTMVQIQTSEYLALGGHSIVAKVDWALWQQPVALFTGQAPIGAQTAWMYGWGVEILTLVVSLGLGHAVSKVSALNGCLARGFMVASLLLLALNSVADYQSSPGTNDMVRFLIALLIGTIVACGLPVGIGLLEAAWEQYRG